ncbi:MAG: cation-translocating P-type ATPase C-terminal domain-containing protein, partial [Candidatus ainarchaeum sp.]|nr:cation-translocating P-type ATPase C-terminal domain-containing protein [Candidatus ainarchaeum sp.]
PLPITAVQILWINLIEDGLPNIALAFEPKEKDLMDQKPQKRNVPLLTKEMKVIIFIIGIVTDIFLLLIFFWLNNYNSHDLQYIRTIIFACLAIDSIFYVFCCKSLRQNIWHINIFNNKLLLISALIGFVGIVAAIYVPFLNTLLGTVSLHLSAWYIILGVAVLNIVLIETAKHYFIVRHNTER